MCGIVGYVGSDEALPIVLEGLRRLEYRGYDSAGVAVLADGLTVRKRAGKLAELEAALAIEPIAGGTTAMGHTRWATHGAPTDENAHPHLDCSGRVAVIHNGIVENHQELRASLEKDGHAFASETDTEVVAHLIEAALDAESDLTAAVRSVVARLEGAYSLVVLLGRPPRRAGRREGLFADGGRARHRRDDPCLRHPRGAGAHPVGRAAGGGPDRDDLGRRARDHDAGRHARRRRADHGGLGRHRRAEGRLRLVHAQGDRRAARRDPRHAGRAHTRRTAPARRAAHPRRRAARGLEGVRRRMRHGVPLGARREVRDRALDAPAGRDRDRQRVPLSRPGDGAGHADARRVAVRRDDRHARGGAARPAAGLAGDRGHEHGRVLARARGRRRALHPRRPRDRRRLDQDVRDADGRAAAGGALPGAGARHEVPRGDRRRAGGAVRAARAGRARDRARRARARDRRAVRRCARLPVHRAAHRVPGRARGRAQAEGAVLRARVGLPGRRAEARPDRADRRRACRSWRSRPAATCTPRCCRTSKR